MVEGAGDTSDFVYESSVQNSSLSSFTGSDASTALTSLLSILPSELLASSASASGVWGAGFSTASMLLTNRVTNRVMNPPPQLFYLKYSWN